VEAMPSDPTVYGKVRSFFDNKETLH
jgi:hypothetical protein